jgi:hypothetical protein
MMKSPTNRKHFLMAKDNFKTEVHTNNNLTSIKLAGIEKWRKYEWMDGDREYEITFEKPKMVQFYKGGTTHRVQSQDDIWYLVPSVGHMGCVISFEGTVVA